ncbi:hypothetical protein ACFSQT_25250 [Mesorhizobium calcicola]|uniref:Lipoprotein n=1 Tax=Mesorhizobium calcicola TaxID=1300310 RepID=A0ABW4WI57_9HYPH
MRIKLTKLVVSIGMLSFLQGCSGLEGANGWKYRYGPDPLMPYQTVHTSLINEQDIMDAFATTASRKNADYTWYDTTIVGFNFIDEQCDAYLRELYALDHERDRLKSAISGTGLVVNAILAATPTAKVAMAIVAQAFGLTSQYADTFTNSYLYSGHSSTVLHVVSELQQAYRRQTIADKALINTEPESYQRIRGYLQLCMPPTIEAKIDEALGESKGSSADTNKDSSAGAKAKAVEGKKAVAPASEALPAVTLIPE